MKFKFLFNILLLLLSIQLIFAAIESSSTINIQPEESSTINAASGEASGSVGGNSLEGNGDTSYYHHGLDSDGSTSNELNNNENTTSANYTCGKDTCNSKTEVCQSVYGLLDGCIPRSKLQVSLITKKVNEWSENNDSKNFTQYDATIKNNVNRSIKQVHIYFNPTQYKLRDNSSLWNMIPDPEKENHLILPKYQQEIGPNADFTFGFIISSPIEKEFNLTINQITFA